MSIHVEQSGPVTIVRPSGALTTDDELIDQLIRCVTDRLVGRGGRIALDLGEVTFVSSAGLGALVRIVAQANLQESRVILARPNAALSGMLELTRLNRFFDVAPTLEEACSRLV